MYRCVYRCVCVCVCVCLYLLYTPSVYDSDVLFCSVASDLLFFCVVFLINSGTANQEATDLREDEEDLRENDGELSTVE